MLPGAMSFCQHWTSVSFSVSWVLPGEVWQAPGPSAKLHMRQHAQCICMLPRPHQSTAEPALNTVDRCTCSHNVLQLQMAWLAGARQLRSTLVSMCTTSPCRVMAGLSPADCQAGAPASLRWPKDSAKMWMYSTSHSPRRSGWKPLLHMPQPAKCTMKAGLSTHGLSMSSHLGRADVPQNLFKAGDMTNLKPQCMYHSSACSAPSTAFRTWPPSRPAVDRSVSSAGRPCRKRVRSGGEGHGKTVILAGSLQTHCKRYPTLISNHT